MGHPQHGVWHQQAQTDYYTLKGVLENLFEQLGVYTQCRWTAETGIVSMHPGQTATIKLGKTQLGFLGCLHPALQADLKFKAPVYVFELNVEALYQHLAKKPAVTAVESLSAFPSVQRDVAFSALTTVTHQQVVAALTQTNEPLLQDIQLFDQYQGTQLGPEQRSLAYRLTLQSPTGTLTESEIEAAMAKLKVQLAKQLAITFRNFFLAQREEKWPA
jgi:phenylalanyl-tRNA synthetase beta chain